MNTIQYLHFPAETRANFARGISLSLQSGITNRANLRGMRDRNFADLQILTSDRVVEITAARRIQARFHYPKERASEELNAA